MHIKTISMLLSYSLLAACGGGGGGGGDGKPSTPPPPANSSPVGLWNGTDSIGRTLSAAILDSGEYWAIYSISGNSQVVGGFVQGNYGVVGTKFDSGNLVNFNFEGFGASAGTVSGSFVERKSINLTTAYPNLQGGPLSGTFNTKYDLTPSVAEVAGNYSGQSANVTGPSSAVLTISGDGSVNGSSGGCAYTGIIRPRAAGNVYDVLITFGGAPCLLPGAQVAGIAFYDKDDSFLYAAAVDSGRANGFLLLAQKL